MILQLQILGTVTLAMALGALIGLERELADKPAGLRTHMLVSGAAAFFVALSNAVVADFDGAQSAINTDPIRVIEAVVAGVSFLGAGTIFRRQGESHIEGLTTAASLLFVGAVGVSVAVNRFVLAIGATVLVVLVLRSTYWFGEWRAQRTPATTAEEETANEQPTPRGGS
jgi:putative Mg2+ transporter-C (MgtC) family protein